MCIRDSEKGIFLRLTNKDLPVKGDKKRSYHKVQTLSLIHILPQEVTQWELNQF